MCTFLPPFVLWALKISLKTHDLSQILINHFFTLLKCVASFEGTVVMGDYYAQHTTFGYSFTNTKRKFLSQWLLDLQ